MPSNDHNQAETQEEREQRIAFHQANNELCEMESKAASIKGGMAAVYKRAEVYGWDKKDFAYAKSIQNQDRDEVIAGLKKKLRVAEFFGAVMPNLFTIADVDRTPDVDKAYHFGKAAGSSRKPSQDNPYDLSSEQGQAWMKGFNEGTAEVNEKLADAVADIIPGEYDEDEEDANEEDDES